MKLLKKMDLTLEEAISITEETARAQLAERLPPDCKVLDESQSCGGERAQIRADSIGMRRGYSRS